MAKIKSSNPATDKFSDDDHMPHDYEVVFDEDGGTVACVRQEVADSLDASEDYPGIERVDDESDDEGGDDGVIDGSATVTESEPNDNGSDTE